MNSVRGGISFFRFLGIFLLVVSCRSVEDPHKLSLENDLDLEVDGSALIFEQSRGSYTRGKLLRASVLPVSGVGFTKLFIPRKRGYLNQELKNLIEAAGEEYFKNFPLARDRIQIGDCSGQRGGVIGGHSSHQHGLDSDIAYFRRDQIEQDPWDTTGFLLEFVDPTTGTVSNNFDFERNWFLFDYFYRTGRLNRIFVDAAIKKLYCQAALSHPEIYATEVLRRLRPWPNHGDHLHLRIECPPKDPRCISQEPPDEGSGCEEIARVASEKFDEPFPP